MALEAGEDVETDSLLEPPEGAKPAGTLDLDQND